MNDNIKMQTDAEGESRKPKGIPTCDDIRPILTSYMTHELGDSQSALVREHLRLCQACQGTAREMQRTLDLLSADRSRTSVLDKLSDNHRARIRRSYEHPVIHWIETHHTLFSIMTAVTALALVFAGLTLVTVFTEEPLEDEIQVNWVVSDGGRLDEIPAETPQLVAAEHALLDIPATPDGRRPSATIQNVALHAPERATIPDQPLKSRWNALTHSRTLLSMLAALLLFVLWLGIRFRRSSSITSAPDEDGVTDDGPPPFE